MEFFGQPRAFWYLDLEDAGEIGKSPGDRVPDRSLQVALLKKAKRVIACRGLASPSKVECQNSKTLFNHSSGNFKNGDTRVCPMALLTMHHNDYPVASLSRNIPPFDPERIDIARKHDIFVGKPEIFRSYYKGQALHPDQTRSGVTG